MTSSLMREELPKFIREQGLTFDYVFVTGDIRTAYPPNNQFRQEMADYILEVCAAAGIGVDRLFIVPGNHDVNRDADGRHEAIERVMYGRKGYYDSREGEIKAQDMTAMMAGEADFKAFLGRIYGNDRLQNYCDPENPHFIVETEDFNILHLDTVISYAKGQEATDLIVGTGSVYRALARMNASKPTLVLAHYPFTSLLQDERKVLGTLLQKKGVRLWLAGHEHDQVLQKVHYLHSLQAGELQYEKGNCAASFVVGEYDRATSRGMCFVYRWFDEGWAKYPYVDLDSDRKDRYEFELRPLAGEAVSWLTKSAREANKAYGDRLTPALIESLIPRIVFSGLVLDLTRAFDACWEMPVPHSVLLADGGMGKTTMLLHLCKGSEIPTLYMSAESLLAQSYTIEEYCVRTVFGNDAEAFNRELANRHKAPSMRLILDGLNEVGISDERKFVNEIQKLARLKGVQFLLVSRNDFTTIVGLTDFAKLHLLPLEDNAVNGLFTKKEWEDIIASPKLHSLMGNPMMVTIFKQVCSVLDKYRDVEFLDWRLPVATSSGLFHNYYEAQIALMLERVGEDGNKVSNASKCVKDYLPRLAYEFESAHSLNKRNDEFRRLLKAALNEEPVDSDRDEVIRERYGLGAQAPLDSVGATNLLVDDLHLLSRESATSTSFSHQMFRDYLSATYIIKKTKSGERMDALWNSRPLPIPVMEHIRNLTGDYWRGGLARRVHECAKGRDDAYLMIQNMLDAFPSSSDGNVADYSDLLLKSHHLPDNRPYREKISLRNSAISDKSVGLRASSPKRYLCLAFSENSRFLAAADNGSLYIFDLLNDDHPFFYSVGNKIVRLVFHGDRLYVNCGSLFIFLNRESVWTCSGKIQDRPGHIFNGQLKKIEEAGDELRLRYATRVERYSLADGSLISGTKNDDDDACALPASFDLTALRRSTDLKKDRGEILSVETNGRFKAVSYADGRLELYAEDDLLTVLNKGVSILKDASISGDGTRGATLSFAAFSGKRRIQIWDLAGKKKTRELMCPRQINHIYLSENGNFLIGETDGGSWIYDLDSGGEEWLNEHFISNHAHRLSTFGNVVLRRGKKGKIFSYDLKTHHIKQLKSPCTDPSLLCFLPSGQLAAANSNRNRAVWFDPERAVAQSPQVYGEVSYIQPVHCEPFIAVGMADGRLDIFHTRTKQCTRHLVTAYPIKLIVSHPKEPIFAYSNGRNSLTVVFLDRTYVCGRERSWWKERSYVGPHLPTGILDMGFNADTKSLAVIFSNGRICFIDQQQCSYRGALDIITSLNVNAYDFSECECDADLARNIESNLSSPA